MEGKMRVIVILVVCIGGVIGNLILAVKGRHKDDRILGWLFLVFSLIGIGLSSHMLAYEYYLDEGQQERNAVIDMDFSRGTVESTSFLRILSSFTPDTTVDDVIEIMGGNYYIENPGRRSGRNIFHIMRYEDTFYTIGGKKAAFIRFTFHKYRDEKVIFTISVGVEGAGTMAFKELRQNLIDNALGEPSNSKRKMAKWTGLRLEITGTAPDPSKKYILFVREF